MKFDIQKTDQSKRKAIQDKINSLTKPVGSLGTLEDVALQLCLIQETLTPKLLNPALLLFAADHGITDEGVSPCPKSVTWQMVYNFLRGGAGINVFCDQHNIKLRIVDSGVDYDFGKIPGLINRKVAYGTKNYLFEPAMTKEECEQAIETGAELVYQEYLKGCNIIAFGEMGISNTSSSSIILSKIAQLPLEECVGKGAGHNEEGVKHKLKILTEAVEKHKNISDPFEILQVFGGFEIAMMVGGMLKAAELKMAILVDGFIHTSAVMVANALEKNILDYCIFSHFSNESGHKKMLDHLGVNPIINLNLRLGEGTGSAIAYSIIESAVLMINKMETFKDAEVALNDPKLIKEKIEKHSKQEIE